MVTDDLYPGSLLAIDPASLDAKKNLTGWAWFYNGSLARCADTRNVLGFGSNFIGTTFDRVVVEMPVYYPQNNKADVNDLLRLAFAAGALSHVVACKTAVELVPPREWKGTVKKEVMNNRVFYRLCEIEQDVVTKSCPTKVKRHNVLDAVGIGLHALGRLR